MIREVLTYPHPRLKMKAEPIAEITPEIRELAADMVKTMYKNDGIGLDRKSVV